MSYGNYTIINSSGLWKHTSRSTICFLCVDDFVVKYYSQEDLDHLKNAIEKQYTCKVDSKGRIFLGLTLDWHYKEGYVDISMPDYVKRTLERL